MSRMTSNLVFALCCVAVTALMLPPMLVRPLEPATPDYLCDANNDDAGQLPLGTPRTIQHEQLPANCPAARNGQETALDVYWFVLKSANLKFSNVARRVSSYCGVGISGEVSRAVTLQTQRVKMQI